MTDSPKYREVNLTLYKSIAGSIRKTSKPVKDIETLPGGEITAEGDCSVSINIKNIQLRGWSDSTLSNSLSDQFMSTLICGHFHINLDQESHIRVDGTRIDIPTESHFSGTYQDEESIAGIECTVFKNGYISLVIRLLIPSDVTEIDFLKWLKRPDQIKKTDSQVTLSNIYKNSITLREKRGMDAGPINVAAYYIAHALDPFIDRALERLELEKINFFENGAVEHPWGQWSRPYVGTIYRDFNTPGQDQIPQQPISEKSCRLIIASGRTTPEFYENFSHPRKFLKKKERNVYGSGGNIVFVGSRGWCVWEQGPHNKLMFRLGVVEMTHFVIMALETSLRARRKYMHELQKKGNQIVRDLNLNIYENQGHNAIRSVPWSTRIGKIFSKAKHIMSKHPEGGGDQRYGPHDDILKTTKFIEQAYALAPFDDGATVLVSHLKGHTARAAAIRYERLKHFDATDRAARNALEHYVSGLNSAISYLQSPMVQWTEQLYDATWKLFYATWIIGGLSVFAGASLLMLELTKQH
jgi:hypothetical protein